MRLFNGFQIQREQTEYFRPSLLILQVCDAQGLRLSNLIIGQALIAYIVQSEQVNQLGKQTGFLKYYLEQVKAKDVGKQFEFDLATIISRKHGGKIHVLVRIPFLRRVFMKVQIEC
ncbi:hypothetical protein FGO68_gene15996 [Halteria grandinella]|uniref:Uncharacterized protein n=1 Tax=Halteria grandinella TaxID=5974 RepID=A0A8J8P737_HALGN|nr:hypothetical protein FGO68_gene15996 [Halteria grandinella]